MLIGEIMFSVPTATEHQKNIKQLHPKFRMAIMPSYGTSHLENFFCRRILVVLLFYVHSKHLRSCRDGQLT